MNISAYPYDGGQTATTEAPDLFKGKHLVRRRFPAWYRQIPFQPVQKIGSALNVACRSQAYLNQVLAPRFKAECVVERCNLINPGEGHLHLLADQGQSFFWQVSEFFLDILKDGNHSCLIAIVF